MNKRKLNLKCFISLLLWCFILLSETVNAQVEAFREISGVVSERNGDPLPGVNVVIKGTTNGIVTSFDGKYKIKALDTDVLVFSFIGYETQEINVKGKTTANVQLIEATIGVDEVVVVGYGTQKKSDLTGSVAVVNPEELTRSASPSLETALQGKVAGVNIVRTSGSPGAGANIRIRGIGTINNNAPLYIVDGIQETEFGINAINPDDIESIQVLKDASASAIYGARGANGVVLITTKKGEENKQTLSFKATYGVQDLTKKLNLTNAEEWVELQNRIAIQTGGKQVVSKEDILHDTDWWDEVTSTGSTQDYYLSLRGGTSKSNYNISGGYFNNEGIFLSSGYKRYTFRTNSEFIIKPWIKIGQNFSFSHEYRDRENESGMLSGVINTDPLTPVYDDTQQSGFGVSNYSMVFQPVAEANIYEFYLTENRINGKVYLEIEPTKGLIIRSNIGGIYSLFREEWQYPKYYYNSLQNASESYYQDLRITEQFWFINNFATYSREIDDHNFSVMAGQEAQLTKTIGIGGAAQGIEFTKELKYVHSAATDKRTLYLRNPVETALNSYFARVNYSYLNKYLFTGTYRYDGSSRFGPKKRYGGFPSMALAWKASEEEFFKNISEISSLKFRFGWGKIGNQNIGDYRWSSSWENGAYFINGQEVPAKYIAALGNKEIHWESQVSTNYGLNLGLFDNKFNIEADYFVKNTKEMLVYMKLPSISGVRDPQIQNVGELQNKGVELTASYKNFDRKLKYNLGINFSKYKTEVIELGDIDYFYHGMQRTEVGKPIGLFYGYRTDGLYKDWQDVFDHGFSNSRPGDVKYIDMNGDGVLSGDDRSYIGDPNPDFLMGLSAELMYRNFELSVFMSGVFGGDIYNQVWTNLHGYGFGNFDKDMFNHWTPENQNTDVPRLGNNSNTNYVSDKNVEDGSYLRLQNVRLSYNFSFLKNVGSKPAYASVFLSADNLFTITKYSGLDPEVGNYSNDRSVLKTNTSANPYSSINFGVDGGFFPLPRTIMIGFEVTL